jgi:transketolase
MSSSRQELANAIRALSMDAVQQANSGHPGAPMGMADIAQVLWADHMQHNPSNPDWANRDRFVLSNGHGSMLIYSLLHLTGYALPIEELKNFRQLHSKTPGHPEYGYAPGIETTTGPLGQGLSNAVGMAIAEKTLAAQFNQPNFDVVDHFTYCFLGDGCLMEGISHEVSSLAGTLGLGKLVDNTPARFEAYGWHVIADVDGHDSQAVADAITAAKAETSKPTLICCKTVIGFGSPNKSGSHSSHGAPLGEEEIKATRDFLNWPHAAFEIPADVYAGWDAKVSGAEKEQTWNETFAAYQQAYPELAAELTRRLAGELPADFTEKADAFIQQSQDKSENVASRKASQNSIETFATLLPEVLGGSADLAGSNLTIWSGTKGISADDASGNYIYYGVREFGMSGIMNGIGLHGGFRPFGATFLMFMEYARNAVRMASLMGIPNIFVYTHDSIGQGEDGPTHQPIEQVANLRLTPNLATWRPCDAAETAVAWKSALLRKDGPSALIFSRQGLPAQTRNAEQLANVSKGGYILKDCNGTPEVILIATGSEVGITVDAAEQLSAGGKAVRVVSMPSTTVFDKQDADYRESVLPRAVTKRVAVEAAHVDFWHKYVGFDGAVVGMSTFGESAPGADLLKYFGITTEAVVEAAKGLK